MKLTTALTAMVATTLASALAAPTAEAHQPTKRYARGYCGLHITQHQKNEFGVGRDYQFDIRLYDNNKVQIGGTNGLAIPSGQTRSLDSQLPYTLDITAGNVDRDQIGFAYAGQHWNTGSGQCSLGGYDRGSRQADCGFSC
ncbi:hypothetical protein G7Y79_00032g066540 [Physcia stellaris]|nr:hypothetical protein G7Y79_00032g066540 [Physcia stellaris]